MLHFLLILFVTFFVHAADLPDFEVIKATPQIKSIPSLKTLASKAIIQQMNHFMRHKDDDKQRVITQEYANKSASLPIELQEAFKRRFAKYGMDVLSNIHTAQPFYIPSHTYCMSFDGTLVAYQDKEVTHRFILKNLDTQKEKIIEDQDFSKKVSIITPHDFQESIKSVQPYFTGNNKLLFYYKNQKNTPIFEYVPESNTLIKHQTTCDLDTPHWVSNNLKKLFYSDVRHVCSWIFDTKRILYDIQAHTKTEILGYLSYAEDNHLVTIYDEHFHCYTIDDGNLYLKGGQGTDECVIHFPDLICAKKTRPDEHYPTTLEIWNLPDRQVMRRIVLQDSPVFLSYCNNKLEYLNDSTFYSVDLKTGVFKKNRPILKDEQFYVKTPASFTSKRIQINGLWESRYYLITRNVRIPLEGLNITFYGKQAKDFTRLCGFADGCVPFIYTTPLNTLYKTPLPELFNKLLKLHKKTIE